MHGLQERASGMYRLSAFYFARTASDLPIDCTIPTCFIIIVYFMGGLRYAHCLVYYFVQFVIPYTSITCVFLQEQVCNVLSSFLHEFLFWQTAYQTLLLLYAPRQTTVCCLIVTITTRLCYLQISLRISLAGSFSFLIVSCIHS